MDEKIDEKELDETAERTRLEIRKKIDEAREFLYFALDKANPNITEKQKEAVFLQVKFVSIQDFWQECRTAYFNAKCSP